MALSATLAALPPGIAASWRRSAAAGLSPTSAIKPDPRRDGVSSNLALAAAPVLDDFQDEIAGSELGVVLADRSCRVVDYRMGRPTVMRRQAAAIGLEIGAEFSEETSGTNAIATPAETGDAVFVDGEHHYLTCLRSFSCFGLPIFHPVTSRLVGVIDLTAPAGGFTPLMRPALRHVVNEIRARLLAMSGTREQAVLDAFRRAGRTRPVVAIGGDLTLSNAAARAELAPGDYAQLAELGRRAAGRDRTTRLVLESGATVEVRAQEVAGGHGTLFVLDTGRTVTVPVPRGANARPRAGDVLRAEAARLRTMPGNVLIVGEPGSGRTTVAEAVAGLPQREFRRASAAGDLHGLVAAAAGDGVTVIEEVQLLPPDIALELARAMASPRGRVVLTMTTETTTDAGSAAHRDALISSCAERLALPPLRDRGDEIAALAEAMLREEGASASRLTLAALQVLRGCSWAGNLRELRTVLLAALANRPTGDLTPTDLPAAYREPAPRRVELGALERAELDAIVAALRLTRGNKVQAARHLGISRSTLYQKLRTYGVIG